MKTFISFQKTLTWVVHLDWLGLLAGFADAHSVTGPDPEAVFSLRLESWGHPERSTLTLGCELFPVVSLTRAFTNLHYVSRHSAATVVRWPRPGQNKRVRGKNAHHGAGGRRLGQVWTKHKSNVKWVFKVKIIFRPEYIRNILVRLLCLTWTKCVFE